MKTGIALFLRSHCLLHRHTPNFFVGLSYAPGGLLSMPEMGGMVTHGY